MSGHSKWSKIKRKKSASDARRGQMFTKLGRAMTVAARDGGGDPSANHALASAIEKARDLGMPKENIERAIDRGTGKSAEAVAIESVFYEGYGPGGVALYVEALTDNRRRTAADVRHALSKAGGSLGEPGSVGWIFESKGVVTVDRAKHQEEDVMVAIDAGAEDVIDDGDMWRIVCEPTDLDAVRVALTDAGVAVDGAETTREAKSTVPVDSAQASTLFRLMDALEANDDVGEVHANFDVAPEILEALDD